MFYTILGVIARGVPRVMALAIAGVVLLGVCAPATTMAAPQSGAAPVVVRATSGGFWRSTWERVNGTWKVHGRKVKQCFVKGVTVGTEVLTTLVKAPRSIGSSAVLIVAALNGSAEYIRCTLG
jgi:hypothetical protein